MSTNAPISTASRFGVTIEAMPRYSARIETQPRVGVNTSKTTLKDLSFTLPTYNALTGDLLPEILLELKKITLGMSLLNDTDLDDESYGC